MYKYGSLVQPQCCLMQVMSYIFSNFALLTPLADEVGA